MSEQIYITQETACPDCGQSINAVGGPQEPSIGDLTICMYCQAILVFMEDFKLRPLTVEEWDAFPAEFQVQVAIERHRWKVAKARLN